MSARELREPGERQSSALALRIALPSAGVALRLGVKLLLPELPGEAKPFLLMQLPMIFAGLQGGTASGRTMRVSCENRWVHPTVSIAFLRWLSVPHQRFCRARLAPDPGLCGLESGRSPCPRTCRSPSLARLKLGERQAARLAAMTRNTAHLKGRHNMAIGRGGITIFPRYNVEVDRVETPPQVETGRRLGSGVPGLDELLGGGLLERSVTLVSGSAGVEKSTLGLQFIAEGVKRKEPALYVSLEEGPAEILNSAEGLGLPLTKAAKEGLVEIIYLSREHIQASQFLAILAEKIREEEIQRLVLDSASHIVADGLIPEELRRLLFALIARFKALGVTTVITLESKLMHSTDIITDHGLSPVADNIIMLRYVQAPGEFRPSLAVVKTRGSAHDWGTYCYSIAKGGIRIGERADRAVGWSTNKKGGARKRTKRTGGGE